MTFDDGLEESNIIKNFFTTDNTIEVNYLDKEISYIYPYSKEKEKELKKIMLEQAINRDKKIYNILNKKTKEDLVKVLLSLIPTIMALKGKLQLIFCVSFIIGCVLSIELSTNYEKLKELKKFRVFLSIKKELDKKENYNITKIIEIDPFLRQPINIGTLDNFSYSDVKSIKKELKNRKKVKK